jgi:hypothetical protein
LFLVRLGVRPSSEIGEMGAQNHFFDAVLAKDAVEDVQYEICRC